MLGAVVLVLFGAALIVAGLLWDRSGDVSPDRTKLLPYRGGAVVLALVLLATIMFVLARDAYRGMGLSDPRRYCVVSEQTFDGDYPWRRAGEVGPEFDPGSGCFVPEYVVCVERDSYDVNAWDDPGPRAVEAAPCPSAGPTTTPEGEGATYCVVSQTSRRARSGRPVGEIVRGEAGCMDSESVVCGYFVPSESERWAFGPKKAGAFESAECPD